MMRSLAAVGSTAFLLCLSSLGGRAHAEGDEVPTLGELAGSYTYAGNREKDESAIKAKVDAATAGMGRFTLKRALPRLESSTRVPEQVVITHQGSNVTFKMNGRVVTVPENGGSVSVKTPLGETADASFDVKTATLLQSVSETGAQKKNSYRFNEAGQLVMQVRITNSRLASPVAFSLVYTK